jgi:hypothetical protein
MICPCCHREIPGRELQVDAFTGGPIMRRILQKLQATRDPVPVRTLADFVYADDPNGGPEGAENSIRTTICRMNKRLRSDGWQIKGHKGRGGFRLEQFNG